MFFRHKKRIVNFRWEYGSGEVCKTCLYNFRKSKIRVIIHLPDGGINGKKATGSSTFATQNVWPYNHNQNKFTVSQLYWGKNLAPLILKWNQQWRCCHQQLLLRTAGLEKGAESTALPLTQQCLKAACACGSWISKNHFFFFLKTNHILPLISQPSQGEYIKKKKSLFPFVIVSWILLLGFHIIIPCSALEVKE